MADNEGQRLVPSMALQELLQLLEQNYQWALDVDFEHPEATTFFWYTSEEKLEPRLGIRSEELGSDLELPLDIARQAKAFHQDLSNNDPHQTIAMFLLAHPQHRHIARRVQTSEHHPYSEIKNNLIGVDCMPLDILRCKLSFFGAAKCDPKSNLWTRINMYQGAPLFEDIGSANTDNWWLPIQETAR